MHVTSCGAISVPSLLHQIELLALHTLLDCRVLERKLYLRCAESVAGAPSRVQVMALAKFLKETYGKQSVLDAVKAGGWKAFIDGTLAQATLIHGPDATLVGTDALGNKYYERMTEQYGRHRWVVFADLSRAPSGQEPSTVTPEWHGWLHAITDRPGDQLEMQLPIYHRPHHRNYTGTPDSYAPKGAWQNTRKRNWRKVQTWVPNR